jgi:hypothetical protein
MFTFVRSGQRFAPQCHISFIFLVIFVSYFVYIYAKTSFTGLSTQTIFTIDVQEKWKAYLQRIRTHVSPPDVMLAAHHPGDEMCPWVHAEIILSAFNTRRQELGSTVVEVEWLTGMQKSKKNKSLHNYHDKVIYRPRYLQRLLPTCIGVTERMAVGNEDWLFEPAPRLDSCCRKEAGHAGLQEIMRSSIVDGLAKVTADQLRRSSSGSPWSTLDKPSRPPFREPPVESRAKRAKAEGSCRSMEQQQHLSEQPRTPDSSPDGLDCPHALPESASSKATKAHWPRQLPVGRSATTCPRPHGSTAVADGRADRSRLMCAAPNCGFLVHTDPLFGGFCCRKCHWRLDSGSKCKKKHGELCQQKQAPCDAIRSEPIAPDSPMAL